MTKNKKLTIVVTTFVLAGLIWVFWSDLYERKARRRSVYMTATVNRLHEIGAVQSRFQNEIGDPQHVNEAPNEVVWVYEIPKSWGHLRTNEWLYIKFDGESGRCTSVDHVLAEFTSNP
jgi:hypothetical protein